MGQNKILSRSIVQRYFQARFFKTNFLVQAEFEHINSFAMVTSGFSSVVGHTIQLNRYDFGNTICGLRKTTKQYSGDGSHLSVENYTNK